MAQEIRRGRAPKVPQETQLNKYREEKSSLLTLDNTIKPYNDEIFDKIGKELGMSSKAVHWAVSRNITQIFDEDEAEDIIANSKPAIGKIKNSVQDDEIDYLFDDNDDSVCVIVNISDKKELFYFEFVQQEGPSRSYTTLRPGWTDVLFDIIVRETQSTCVFNFKRANISVNEFKTSGVCGECKGTVKVESKNNRHTLQIEIKTTLFYSMILVENNCSVHKP